MKTLKFIPVRNYATGQIVPMVVLGEPVEDNGKKHVAVGPMHDIRASTLAVLCDNQFVGAEPIWELCEGALSDISQTMKKWEGYSTKPIFAEEKTKET